MLIGRSAKRVLGVLVAAIFVTGCCAAVSFLRLSVHSGPVTAKTPPPRISAPQPIPDGWMPASAFGSTSNHFYTRSAERFRLFDSSGDPLFSVELPGMTDLSVSPNGRYAMAYSRRNPADSTALFLDRTGNTIWQMNMGGAIWSATACATDAGARFVVGTGDGYIYVINIGDKSRRYSRWRAPGAVVSMALSPDGEVVTFGTWQRSSVCRATIRGRTIWRMDADDAQLHMVSNLRDGGNAFVRSAPVCSGRDGSYTILDRRGRQTASGTVSTAGETQMTYSPNGRYLCFGNRLSIEHKNKRIYERHAILGDTNGSRFWEKGSPFFQAVPMMVTSQGYVLLNDGERSLFLVSPTGSLQPSVKLPGRIKQWIASDDGTRLLITCAGGKLYLVRLA